MSIMKTIKRIISLISSVAVCAVPLLSASVVNAASSEKGYTYAIYCDVPANSGVMWANLEFVYKDIEEIESHVGNCGGEVTDASGGKRTDGTQSFAACFRADSALISPGNLFTTKLITKHNKKIKDLITNPRTTSFDAKNNFMEENQVTFEFVLVGDVNEDNVVNMADSTEILQYVGNPSTYPIEKLRAADVNFDGIIDSKDSDLIQLYDAGVINCF